MEESVKLAPEGGTEGIAEGIAGTKGSATGARAFTGKSCMPTNIPITTDCDRFKSRSGLFLEISNSKPRYGLLGFKSF